MSELLVPDKLSWRDRFNLLPRVLPFVILLTGVMIALYGGFATVLKPPVRCGFRESVPRKIENSAATRSGQQYTRTNLSPVSSLDFADSLR